MLKSFGDYKSERWSKSMARIWLQPFDSIWFVGRIWRHSLSHNDFV